MVHCDEGEYEAIRTIFEQLRTEMGVESVSPADSGDEFHTLYLKNKLVELIVLFCRAQSAAGSLPARPRGDPQRAMSSTTCTTT